MKERARDEEREKNDVFTRVMLFLSRWWGRGREFFSPFFRFLIFFFFERKKKTQQKKKRKEREREKEKRLFVCTPPPFSTWHLFLCNSVLFFVSGSYF